MLMNDDLKPVEEERRQWGAWNFVAFWIADSFNINTWMISSVNIVDGLSWWQSWLCVWLGYTIAACFVCLTGRIGAMYHITFSVVNRASFGIWGASWPVFNRAAMACVWYGVQAWIGGTCVYLMIQSIWSDWRDVEAAGPNLGGIENNMSPSGTTSVQFTSFVIFWLASLPFIYPPVHQIRHLFTVKAIVVPAAGIAFFIWSIARAKGIGPIVHQPSTATGSTLAWLMIRGTMSAIANFATLIMNNPDFARFARKPSHAVLPQLITIPTGFALMSLIGIVVSSSSTVIYGKAIWNPLELLEAFLDKGGSGTRAAVFGIAASFALAQLGTNIAANSVSAGTDLTALLPRWVTIRRGGYICACIGLLMRPWRLLQSTSSFITYLSAYSVFLSSIAGVMVSDYYLVRKGYLSTRDLYSASKTGPYYYAHGFHWRGYAAYLVGILVNLAGFAGAVGYEVPDFARKVYEFNYFAGFFVALGMYYGLCKLSPIRATSDEWLEVGSDEILGIDPAYEALDGGAYEDEVTRRGNHGWNVKAEALAL